MKLSHQSTVSLHGDSMLYRNDGFASWSCTQYKMSSSVSLKGHSISFIVLLSLWKQLYNVFCCYEVCWIWKTWWCHMLCHQWYLRLGMTIHLSEIACVYKLEMYENLKYKARVNKWKMLLSYIMGNVKSSVFGTKVIFETKYVRLISIYITKALSLSWWAHAGLSWSVT